MTPINANGIFHHERLKNPVSIDVITEPSAPNARLMAAKIPTNLPMSNGWAGTADFKPCDELIDSFNPEFNLTEAFCTPEVAAASTALYFADAIFSICEEINLETFIYGEQKACLILIGLSMIFMIVAFLALSHLCYFISYVTIVCVFLKNLFSEKCKLRTIRLRQP